MKKYNIFLTLFIVSVIAFIVLVAYYINAVFSLAFDHDGFLNNPQQDPFAFFRMFLSTGLIVSAIVLGLTSLAIRILGIVWVAKNKLVTDGEKVIWVIGFVLMGFVTSIVFLVMAKGKKFVD